MIIKYTNGRNGPRYTDSAGGVFLGQYKKYDLYYWSYKHTRNDRVLWSDESLYARFAKEAYAYKSGICFVGNPNCPEITEAAKLAMERNLLSYDTIKRWGGKLDDH